MKAKYRSCCCHCGHSAYHPQLGYTTQNQLMPPKKLAVRDSIFSSRSHVPSSQVAALPCHLQLGNCAPRPQSADPRKIISLSAVISTEGALRRSVTKYFIQYYFYFPISLFLSDPSPIIGNACH